MKHRCSKMEKPNELLNSKPTFLYELKRLTYLEAILNEIFYQDLM